VQADEARAHADDLKRHVARLEQVRTTDERASAPPRSSAALHWCMDHALYTLHVVLHVACRHSQRESEHSSLLEAERARTGALEERVRMPARTAA
jgi:hypothetical protein